MMFIELALALQLLHLTGPTGAAVYVSPKSIISLRDATHYHDHVASGVHCLVQTPGKTFGVADKCGAISIMLGK